eukprot:1141063-Pelagomonas_calceolata.AAC.5
MFKGSTVVFIGCTQQPNRQLNHSIFSSLHSFVGKVEDWAVPWTNLLGRTIIRDSDCTHKALLIAVSDTGLQGSVLQWSCRTQKWTKGKRSSCLGTTPTSCALLVYLRAEYGPEDNT